MAEISAIKLPNGNTYNVKDVISGYTKNTGTITGISTSAPLSGSGTSGSVSLSISAASTTARGTMSSAHYTYVSELQTNCIKKLSDGSIIIGF